MVSIQYHVMLNCFIWAFFYWLFPEVGVTPLVLLLLADFVLDVDHLYKHKSVVKVAQKYNKSKGYMFHKIWIIFPLAIGALLTPLFWIGVGLIMHFILDFIENFYLFGWKFKWI